MNRLIRLGVSGLAIAVFFLALGNKYYLNIAVFAGFNALLAVGLNLLLGLAGQVSLGHAAFYGLGAYTAGILAVRAQLPAWLCLPAALLLTAGVAYLIGLPTLRLRGHYLALATLGFGIIVQILLVEAPYLTGGPSGLIGIPSMRFGSLILRGDRVFAILVWLIIIAVQAACGSLRKSRAGRALLAIQSNEVAAAALGVDTGREKRAVFVVSATLAALAGALYAYYINFISPETFGFGLSVEVLTMVIVGGLGSIWGPVLGALLLTIVPEVFRAAKDYRTILYGLVLILAVAFLPQGLAGAGCRIWRWIGDLASTNQDMENASESAKNQREI